MTIYRPRGFRTGKMRERVDVQTATVVETTGQPVRTWADTFTDEPAAFEQVSGGETLRGRQVEANVAAVFTVHFREGYSTGMRVVYGGKAYGIERVMPVEGGRRYIELHCKAAGAL